MGLRLKYRNSLVRLAAALVLVLALLAVIVGHIYISMNYINKLHDYKLSYVTVRDDALLSFHHEFLGFEQTVREFFYLHLLEAQVDTGYYVDNASFSFSRLSVIAYEFIRSLKNDPLHVDINREAKIAGKEQIMAYTRTAYADFIVFSETIYYVGDGARDINIRAIMSLENAEEWLVGLRELSFEARSYALAYINANIVHMQRTLYLLLFAFAVLFAALIYLSVKMIANLMKGAKVYREKVLLIKEDDLSTKSKAASDISDMITEMTNTFSSLVQDINTVAEENNKGNAKARMDTNKLYGIYIVAANAINSLLDVIDKERSMNETRQLMFDAAPVVMTVFDKNLNIFDCNEEGLRRYGFKSKEDYAKNFFDASPKYQPDGMLSLGKGIEMISKCFENGYASFEWIHQTLDGEPIPSEVICFPLKYNGKDVMLSYAIDIRELKKSVEMAREADERTKLMVDLQKERVKAAEENSKIKSRFLARMSHEIRTPIAAVLGISEIHLRTSELSPELDEAFAKIHSSASTLLGIVNDILDLSKIEAGKMSIMEEKYELAGLISDVVNLNLAFLGSKKIDFLVNVDENLPSELLGDELRLKQVLNNLLSNAFKYTPHGTVELEFLKDEASDADYTNIKIIINDTGTGMTPQQLEALFDEYARFSEDDTKIQAGTGLGMPITKSLITMMGGTMDVSSSFGVGTRVVLKFRQKTASDKLIGASEVKDIKEFRVDSKSIKKKMSFVPEPMPYGKILVVDDVDTNLYVARGLMQIYELQIETCDSGYAAVDKVKEGNVYDIIFMDHMMPGMDGVETTEKIRELGYTAPIIALTANALIGQAEEYIRRGFDGFISKPIQATPLDAALNKYVRDKNFSDIDDLGIDLSDFDDEPEEFTASEEMMQNIRQDFLESQKDAYKNIMAAVEADDAKTAMRLTHNLKNLAAMINDKELTKAAEAVEKGLANASATDEMYSAMERELARAIESLDKHKELGI